MFGLFAHRHREDLRALPFPEAWSDILKKNLPLYDRLPELDRAELHGHVQVFLAEKHFEGCGGLEITDEIRLTIAGQACMLLLHRETDYFRKLITILIYPSAYVAQGTEHIGGGLVLAGEQARLGEAWVSGVVVLSWDDVQRGAFDPRDGQNVVLHEFAHQLDQEDGEADGAPILKNQSKYAAWSRILGHDFDELRADEKANRKTVLDGYGATNPAEFFAVATECFFEKPIKLKKKHPELYDQLRTYYHFDPEATLGNPPSAS
jgi:MtfA peptidase